MKDPIKAAIAWEVRLRSGEATTEDFSRFDAWRSASHANANAWNSLQAKLRPFQALATQAPAAGREALLAVGRERRNMLKLGLKGTLGLAVCGVVSYRVVHELGYDAQFRTGTAERRTVALTPNIHALLDADTTVYTDSRPHDNRWRLHSGRMLVSASNSARFAIASKHGAIHTQNARFSIGVFDLHTVVAMESGQGKLTLKDGTVQPIAKGEVVGFSSDSIQRRKEAVASALAWTSGLHVASNESVGDLIAVLRRYHHGLIEVSSTAARRRVSGVFSLNHPNEALRQLAESLSLKIDSYGNFLVVVRNS
ncbi:hypothetical protein PATSB16_09520 [Pandoraea thiooxydans]|nr:hypothetical protein PATSB16_09520 [Pandoraea thiooxydans]